MKGTNTIKLNEETVVAALQCYFNTQYQAGKVPIVKSVEFVTATGYQGDKTFDVSVEEEVEKAEDTTGGH